MGVREIGYQSGHAGCWGYREWQNRLSGGHRARPGLKTAMDLHGRSLGTKKGNSRFYDTAEPRETVPAVFGLLIQAEGHFRESVVYATNFGRDADTIASIIGSIACAFEDAIVI